MREKKIRITKLDSEYRVISDKLLMQDPELYTGPKEPHEGPLQIEVMLFDKADVEKFKAYLDKLVGNLPIEAKAGKKAAKSIITGDEYNPAEKAIELMGKVVNQDELIKELRSQGYVFLSDQFIDNLESHDQLPWEWKEDSHRELQFLVPLVKRAKNPLADKYDFRIAIGIDLNGKKPGVITYELGKYASRFKLPWATPESHTKAKKKAMAVFPQFMSEEERAKFRLILRKKETEMPLTSQEDKFFTRWVKWVKLPD